MAKGNGGGMSPQKTRIDELVAQYIQIRDRMKEIESEHKKTLEPFQAVKDKLTMRILAFLDATGQEMARTLEGTVTKSVNRTASLDAPDEFVDFVIKHKLPYLLNRSANANACVDYAQEHGALPPGVTINSIRTIRVRNVT
jgi:hypothetical protein